MLNVQYLIYKARWEMESYTKIDGKMVKQDCHLKHKTFFVTFSIVVFGLSYDTNETVLKDAFRQHGEIIEVKIICDHVSGKSQGYGFVQFTSESAASMALKEMNGQFLDGRHVRVCFAHKG
ncbi:hypothetical protein GH714_004217 [Hevea brasiliensis]|uniref:RRM domain-containing protein n=1 Tax=Hevea brasiliensis TaxID=3981 RepID=A0A6A6NC42_HEVBR|nr:hypothetical protein GH714_004217 [Hevea brasiliensis]